MLRALVVLSVLSVSFAAQAIGPLEPKPAKFNNVPGCYIRNLDKVIPFGTAAPDTTSCMEYACGETIVTYTTCGAVHADPPLMVVEDKTKPYPDCCPKIKLSIVKH